MWSNIQKITIEVFKDDNHTGVIFTLLSDQLSDFSTITNHLIKNGYNFLTQIETKN